MERVSGEVDRRHPALPCTHFISTHVTSQGLEISRDSSDLEETLNKSTRRVKSWLSVRTGASWAWEC